MSESPVLQIATLSGPPWPTLDPFLFCVHHKDDYPKGNDAMGPEESLQGRRIGMDFEGKDGWSMYHGALVPGFPRHPHRGFETVTLARRGYIDHSDSLGATARFGDGDAQWMTAGNGIVHSEMFPLVHRDADNPTELFQIWLNLPREDKLVDAHFKMLWSELIPRPALRDEAGCETHIAVVAGRLGEFVAPTPPPNSWAARADADVAIWTIRMQPGATWTLPAASAGLNRALYFFAGSEMRVADQDVPRGSIVVVRSDVDIDLVNGDAASEMLMLQGRPIGEPVAHHGPFVMNTHGEIREAIEAYQSTQFGGWPWGSDGPVHSREAGRFAKHANGRQETPEHTD